MNCSQCQYQNRQGAKYCKECGARLELACPKCGTRHLAASKFCDECGQDLRNIETRIAIDFAQPKTYTPKFLADKILNSRSSIEGERKLVTVLFADVAHYIAMAEKLDPEVVHQIMDGCFNILMNEIHKYEGTINQFTGDGIMALFGAPVAHEDHAQRACYASLAIQHAMTAYGKKIGKDLGIDFKMRIGINSGLVVVGAIGDDLRMDYTAIGDTTNLAARMESLAAEGSVLVSQNTYRLAKDFFEFEFIDRFKIEGKEKLQAAYTILKATDIATRMDASAAKGLTQFIGRKNSLAILYDALEKIKSGQGQVVGIMGEAGVGKSRLIFEMKNTLPRDQFTYLEGHCLHYGATMPYLPFIDIIKKYFNIKEGESELLVLPKIKEKIHQIDETLITSMPSLLELLSLKVEDEQFSRLDPEQKRERLFEALRDLFIRESQSKTLILVIDDLHWMDKMSEQFLDYFIEWLATSPILLLLLYRPEYIHQWGNKSYYHNMNLGQLTHQSSVRLIQAILDGCEIAPELEELILNRASGNPLYMEELTQNLLENGSIKKIENQCVLAGEISEIHVPDTIQGIIAARIDRIEENLKRIMQVASVIGREFAYRILQTITGMREDLKSQLLNLQGLEFIYEKRLFPELEYIFKHALTQEVAYNSLLLQRRKEIHQKIGTAIESLYATNLEEYYEMLAYHYAGSDQTDNALKYLELANAKSMNMSAMEEARAFFERALQILDVMSDTPELSNHETGELDPPERIEPNKVVVIEGLHPIYDERVRSLLDFSVYLDISDEVKIQWKIQRDMAERGHTYEDVLASINARKPDFSAYIEPQKEFADVVIQVLPTQLVQDKESKLLRVRLVQKEGIENFETVYLFDEGSTIDWRPCGRKLTCSYPGIKMYYGPDSFMGNEVSMLEVDGQFDNLEEMIYLESHLSRTGTKHYGEMTELLLKHKEYPGSNNGTGLFQVLVGLKMRETYEKLTAVKETAAV